MSYRLLAAPIASSALAAPLPPPAQPSLLPHPRSSSFQRGLRGIHNILSDDIWVVIACILAAGSLADLIQLQRVCKRFAMISRMNECWFSAYTSMYPKLTRSFLYRGDDPHPPNWRLKLLSARKISRGWKRVGVHASTDPPAGEMASLNLDDFPPETGSPLSSTPTTDGSSRHSSSSHRLDPPISRPWSYLLSEVDIYRHLAHFHDNATSTLAISTMIPDILLDFPILGNDLTAENASTPFTAPRNEVLLGVCVVHKLGSPLQTPLSAGEAPRDGTSAFQDDRSLLRSTVMFYDVPSMTILGGFTMNVSRAPLANTGFNTMVLRYVDSIRDVAVMVEEDEDMAMWSRLVFLRLSMCMWDESFSGGTDVSMNTRETRVLDVSHPAYLSELKVPSGYLPFTVARCPGDLGGLPRHSSTVFDDDAAVLLNSILVPTQTSILVGVTDDESQAGFLMFVQHERNRQSDPRRPNPQPTPSIVLGRALYGKRVTCLEIGEPYEPIVLTGHTDHRVKVWDLSTGTLLLAVQSPGNPTATLGFAWVDEPEGWLASMEPGAVDATASSALPVFSSSPTKQRVSRSSREIIPNTALSRPRGSALVSYADLHQQLSGTGGGSAGEFAIWDLGSWLRRARKELARRRDMLRAVSAPPYSLNAMGSSPLQADPPLPRVMTTPATTANVRNGSPGEEEAILSYSPYHPVESNMSLLRPDSIMNADAASTATAGPSGHYLSLSSVAAAGFFAAPRPPPSVLARRNFPPPRVTSLNIPVVARHLVEISSAGNDGARRNEDEVSDELQPPQEDAIATFTVMHPILVLLTLGSTLQVVDLESGQLLAKVTNIGRSASSSSGRGFSDAFKSPGILRCPCGGASGLESSAEGGRRRVSFGGRRATSGGGGVLLLTSSGIVKVSVPL
ncbi:hypothetical protein DFJ73DRAFT_826700 [Zopfochytrium polystomum]|nr:hypothetical protein DFJ73DRAFT_826700 [Zopfochytrium polystomum]